MEKRQDEKHGQFYITQDVALFNERGELLALRSVFGGRWLLPGGHINEGEDGPEALRREVREETGIEAVELGGVFDTDTWTNREGAHYGVFFLGRVRDAQVVLSEEHTEYRWLGSLAEVEALDWWVPELGARARQAWQLQWGER